MKPSHRDKRSGSQETPAETALADGLLAAARAFRRPVKVTFADIQTAVRLQRSWRAGLPARWMLAGAVAAVLLVVMGGVALSRGWLGLRQAMAPTFISVPAGATTRVERRGHFRLALRGPGAVELGGSDESMRLEQGNLEVENQAHPVTVETTGRSVEIAPSSTVTVDVPERSVPRGVAERPGRTAPAVEPPAVAPPPPSAAPTGVSRPTVPPSALPIPARASASAAVIDVGSPAAEITAVRDAIASLRAQNDPAGAVARLDDYERHFPHGLLRDEAAAMRIEALLALGQSAEAMQRLEALPQAALDRSPRLRIARGELRASHGRCQDALADFGALLSTSSDDEIARRALRGRATCLRLRGEKISPL